MSYLRRRRRFETWKRYRRQCRKLGAVEKNRGYIRAWIKAFKRMPSGHYRIYF